VVFAPAHPPAVLRDSLAAGDVFNAAIIDGLMASGVRSVADVGSADLRALLERANRLAGCKCGMKGLDGLAAAARGSGWPGGGGP
jgi:sugar/nucleoside kinase (ribokinase family)